MCLVFIRNRTFLYTWQAHTVKTKQVRFFRSCLYWKNLNTRLWIMIQIPNTLVTQIYNVPINLICRIPEIGKHQKFGLFKCLDLDRQHALSKFWSGIQMSFEYWTVFQFYNHCSKTKPLCGPNFEQCLKFGPFDNRMAFNHLNTWLFWYSDGPCIAHFFKKSSFERWKK